MAVRYTRTNAESHELVGHRRLVIDASAGEYVVLNDVAATVWDLLREPRLVGELVELLIASYEGEPEQITADVVHCLALLEERGLVSS